MDTCALTSNYDVTQTRYSALQPYNVWHRTAAIIKHLAIVKRSEEVQDIIDRMPTHWCWWVAGLVALLMGCLIALSCFIRYPETVDGHVSITGKVAPVRLIAMQSGRLHPLLTRGAMVKPGDVVAYMESGAKYEDFIQLKTTLTQGDTTSLVHTFELGELSPAYNAYTTAKERLQRLQHSKRYTAVRRSLQEQISANSQVASQLLHTQAIKAKIRANLAHDVYRDSLLHSRGMSTLSELEAKRNLYYQQLESETNLQVNQLTKQAEIKTSQLEIARSYIEEEETLEEAWSDMQAKRQALLNELRLWEEKYLIRATMAGRLDYLGFWRDNMVVTAGTEVFSILPYHNTIIGEAYIASQGAGKIAVGQEVNVKLSDYPYDEFGLLKAKVAAISSLTQKPTAGQQVVESYLVELSFPNGLTTNFGYELPLNFERKGTAEIITKPKRLIERLFDNLKARTTK